MQYDEIKRLIDDVGNSNIDDISLEFPDGLKINIKKNASLVTVAENKVSSSSISTTQVIKEVESTDEENYKIITSPVVGTFYSKSAPTANPYVHVGQKVKKGDVLCIIEAMKLMNEIEAECSGEIIEILAKDEDMVDYGKPLFKIKEM
jgi:acetyl-CoA carboxylase biotin carboxyl carrier protein